MKTEEEARNKLEEAIKKRLEIMQRPIRKWKESDS